MFRQIRTVSLSLLIVFLSGLQAVAGEPSATTLAMAKVVGPPSLINLCTMFLKNTVTYGMMVNQAGEQGAEKAVNAAMLADLQKFEPAWVEINAKAYDGRLTQDEMQDIISGHPSQLTQLKFHSLDHEVGSQIHRDGQTIMNNCTSTVLLDAFTSLKK